MKNNLTCDIKATMSTGKIIKIQFNFALWFINWMPNQTHRQKKNLGPFSPCQVHHSLMAPCKSTQCYDQANVDLIFWMPSVLSVYK